MSKDLIKDYWPIEQEAVLLIKTELSEFLQNFKPNRLSFPGTFGRVTFAAEWLSTTTGQRKIRN